MRLLIAGIIIFFTSFYFYLIWPRLSHKQQIRPFLHTMFAHRGYHCIEKGIPENSLSSFRAAISHGYGIELDLHLSTDGKLVVFHDDDLSRICGRPEAVEVLPSKELQRCRLQDTTETIPLFSEVLSLVDGQVPLLIELKIPKSSLSICEKTWEALKNYNGPYMVQSFNTWHLVVPPPCATCPERSAFFQSDCRQSSGTMDTDFYCKTSARQCTRTS